MTLNTLDWLVVVACLLIAFAPAILLARRAGRSATEFFASGRAAPWWLIGTSMVATTFSTDTPNLVTDFVRGGGVAKNWSWWAFLLTGMLTVFFYARLWRRSGVLTDLEFYEVRYSGRPASFVRGFRAIYLGLLFNCVIMASVTLAAAKIANVMLGWDRSQTVVVCGAICIAFSVLSGLWGVLAADLIQFAIAMVGVIAAAYYALEQPQVSGLSGLLAKVDPDTLRLLPDFGDWELTLTVLIIPLAVQWWAVWYPGAEPGGGSYIAQRMLAAKDERHALAATLWFNIAHYALRPWPWIIVALCSLLVFPTLGDLHRAFPQIDEALLGNDIAYPAMLTLLPHGLLGLLVASLLSAYVSTMSTHLNWGASYLVHDFYRRFVCGDASERHYVAVSRLVTVVLMLLAGSLTFALTTAQDAFNLMLSIGAGTGLIYLLRWYWWRINAWSEITAMVVSFAVSALVFTLNRALNDSWAPVAVTDWLDQRGWLAADADGALRMPDHIGLVVTVAITTAAWLIVTYVTPPANRDTLMRFCRLVRPAGPGWKRVRALPQPRAAGPHADSGPSPDSLPMAMLAWLLGCTMVYAALFGTGALLYWQWAIGAVCMSVCLASAIALAVLIRRMWRPDATGGQASDPRA